MLKWILSGFVIVVTLIVGQTCLFIAQRNELDRRMFALEQLKLELGKSSQSQTALALEDAISDLKARVEKRFAETADDIEVQIRQVNDRRLAGDRQAAVAARETAKTLLLGGKRDEAEVYLLNAINHNPEDASILMEYGDAVLRDDVDSDDLNQARSVMQLAIYQVPPEQIPPVLGLMKRVDVAQQKLIADAAAKAPPLLDWVAEFKRLKETDTNIYTDAAKLQLQIDSLRNIMANVGDGGAPADVDLAKRVEAELGRWLAIQGAQRQAEFVDACLQKLNGQVAVDSDAAISVAQSAENALPQFWALDFQSLPTALVVKIKSYPGLINKLVNDIAEARAKPLLMQIEECKRQSEVWDKRTYDSNCRLVEAKLMEANQAFGKIGAQEARKKAEEIMQQMSRRLGELRKSQFNEYQKWALQVCLATLKDYNTYNAVTDSNAWKIFELNGIYKIDPAVLSPEVGRCLNDVLGKLFDEMYPTTKVYADKKISEEKLVLEKF